MYIFSTKFWLIFPILFVLGSGLCPCKPGCGGTETGGNVGGGGTGTSGNVGGEGTGTGGNVGGGTTGTGVNSGSGGTGTGGNVGGGGTGTGGNSGGAGTGANSGGDGTGRSVGGGESEAGAGGNGDGNAVGAPDGSKKCGYTLFERGQDPCGLRKYAQICSAKGPCAYNINDDYLPVFGNPNYFVQCGSARISHCQMCAPGTRWFHKKLTCIKNEQ